MNVKVVGIGGIGCCLLPILARYLCYSYSGSVLVLIDGDSFESSNQERQPAKPYANKATEMTLQLRYMGFNNLAVNARPVFITEENIDTQFMDGDIIILCVDNHETRNLVSQYVEKEMTNASVISGGNDLTTGNIQVYVRKGGINLTLPIANKDHEEIANSQRSVTQVLGCRELAVSQPQLLITNNAVAAAMLNAFYALVTNQLEYHEAYVDIVTGNSRAVKPTDRL